jgi:hypothetical protein
MPQWLRGEIEKNICEQFETKPCNYDEYEWLENVFDKPNGIRVSSGGTYEFRNMDDRFVAAMNWLRMCGAGK